MIKPKLTEYIREIDVLHEWPMSKATLIRARKKGLSFVRLGCYVCYRPEDLEAYFCRPRSWKASDPTQDAEGKRQWLEMEKPKS